LSDAVTGGTWSSLNPSIATVGSLTGVVTGVATSSTQIEYATGPGCYVLHVVTVNPGSTPAVISGPTTVCVGSTITLTDATPGGVWSSVSPSVATVVSTTGVVTGVSAGYDSIRYTITTSCGSAYIAHGINVVTTVTAGTITGTTTATVGGTTTLSDAVTGGTWTSSNTSIATVDPTTGLVTGVAAGTVTISYTVTGCGGTATATATVTITTPTPTNRISGHVRFTGGSVDSFSTVKIWLIHYDPSTSLLTAIDSTWSYAYDTSIYYQFLTAGTDSFRVKAAYFPVTFSGTGYIPTYHYNYFYWHDANVIYHVNPSADDNEDILMGYGSVTAGPGFIAGDVTTGANRGTSGTVPTVNQLVYLLNASGTIIQQIYTNGAGQYQFNGLPAGTYSVYPEDINYKTTPYVGITLTTSSPNMSVANFGKHSVSKTILPATTGIQNVNPTAATVIAFPNPTNGKVNILWNAIATENATVSVTDVTGQTVYTTTISMNQGNGASQVDLSNVANGVYLLSVKSATINYNNKIQLQH